MKKIMFFAAMAAMVLTQACSNDGNSEQQGYQEGNAISFRSVVDKSRASLISNTTQLTSFFVHAGVTGQNNLGFMSAAVYREGANWVYSPVKYYPTTGTLDFYAYAPIKDVNMTTPVNYVGTSATFGYTVPFDQSAMNTSTDLLVASVLGNNASPVALTFNHALSAVKFSASNQNAPSTNLIVRISGIEITELDNVGTFTYPWSNVNTCWTNPADADVTYKAGIPQSGVFVAPAGTPVAYVSLLSANDVMMVLPQTPAALGTITAGVPDDNGTYVKVYFEITDATGQLVSGGALNPAVLAFPSGFAFQPGVMYNFQFDFTENMLNPISFTVTVDGWAPETDVPLQ
jgi:hypothetical protein